MDYSSITSQGKLLLHYLSSSEPARLGLGYGRWFVFLAKAGARHSVLACGLLYDLLGLGFFSWKLRKAVMELSDREPLKPVERVATVYVTAEKKNARVRAKVTLSWTGHREGVSLSREILLPLA